MAIIELMPTASARSATGAAPRLVPRAATRGAGDFLAVTAAWTAAVLAAAVLPVEGSPVARGALFVHLISMAVGFGAVVMIDVYGLMWLFGKRTVSDLVALAGAAHGVIAAGVGCLLASGVALHPDLDSPLARLKLLLVLVLMLNSVAARRYLEGLKTALPTEARGANIPWAVFQRGLAAALVSQATWWGAIAIGFLTNAARHVRI